MIDSNDDGKIVNPGTSSNPQTEEPGDAADEANDSRFREEAELIREQAGEAQPEEESSAEGSAK